MTTLIALFCCFENEFQKSCLLCRNFISIFRINSTLHGRLGTRILSSHAESISHSLLTTLNTEVTTTTWNMIYLLLRANQLSSLRQLLQKTLSNSQENIALLNRINKFSLEVFHSYENSLVPNICALEWDFILKKFKSVSNLSPMAPQSLKVKWLEPRE